MAQRVGLSIAMLAAATFGAGGCDIVGPDMSTDAQIEFVNIEGGCWLVVTSERSYEPMNLPESFRIDGLSVRIEAEFLWDRGSFCTGPPYLDIKKIERAGV